MKMLFMSPEEKKLLDAEFHKVFGAYPEGVSFAILIANLLVYYLDRYTKPRNFGALKKGKGGKQP